MQSGASTACASLACAMQARVRSHEKMTRSLIEEIVGLLHVAASYVERQEPYARRVVLRSKVDAVLKEQLLDHEIYVTSLRR